MTKNIIRIIISSYYLLLIFSIIFDLTGSGACTNKTSCKILDEIPDSMFLLGTISALGSLILFVISYIGIIRFKNWSRIMFVVYFFLFTFAVTLFKPYTSFSFTDSGSILYFALTLGLIALIYSSYFSNYVKKNN